MFPPSSGSKNKSSRWHAVIFIHTDVRTKNPALLLLLKLAEIKINMHNTTAKEPLNIVTYGIL
jgi:hypothetical protein